MKNGHYETAKILKARADKASSVSSLAKANRTANGAANGMHNGFNVSPGDLEVQLEEMELSIRQLKSTIEQLLSQKGVVNYVNGLKAALEAVKLENTRLQTRNNELHSFLMQNNQIYATNNIDRPDDAALDDRYISVDSLRLENDSLKSKIRFERTVSHNVMESKNREIERLRREIDNLTFKLDSRRELLALNGNKGAVAPSSLQHMVKTSPNSVENVPVGRSMQGQDEPSPTSISGLLYEMFLGEGDFVVEQEKS